MPWWPDSGWRRRLNKLPRLLNKIGRLRPIIVPQPSPAIICAIPVAESIGRNSPAAAGTVTMPRVPRSVHPTPVLGAGNVCRT